MQPLLPEEYDVSDASSMSEGTILGLAVLGVLINLGMIVATVILMPEMQNSCRAQHDCKSHEPGFVKYN